MSLEDYVQHADDCPWEMREGEHVTAVAPCSCGLDRALAAHHEQLAAAEQRIASLCEAHEVLHRRLAEIRSVILEQLPRHLLWRLVDAYQRYQSNTDSDDEYVKLADVFALFPPQEPEPEPRS